MDIIINDKHELLKQNNNQVLDVTQFDCAIVEYLNYLGLPSNNLFAPISERSKVFKNVEDVLSYINSQNLPSSLYLSKFIAAVASGLFDAALNYLWDETINQLRNRVANYDLMYFYDVAVSNIDKRKKLNDVDDLKKVDDSELILGCKEIGLISDIGFKHLDYIKYMRNWASAAHPNQTEITGLNLLSWLETCIKEVICLPLTSITIQINQLLANIKNNAIDSLEASNISSFFIELTDDKADTLANGFFGIYTRKDTTQQTRDNVSLLINKLWPRVSEQVRQSFGIKYAQFVANNETEQSVLAKQFLELCGALSYIPDGVKTNEIKDILDGLNNVHNSMNNFYSEPTIAKQLSMYVGSIQIPKQCYFEYVNTLINVYLTNGYGVAWSAEPIYIDLIQKFNQEMSLIAILSFTQDNISSKLQFSLCKDKFVSMLDLIKPKITSVAIVEIIDKLVDYKEALHKLKNDTKFNEKINIIKTMLKL